MKTLIRFTVTAAAIMPGMAWAAEGTKEGGISWLAILFIAFFAGIVLFQLVPAIVLFGSMVVALFTKPLRKGAEQPKTVPGE